MSWGGAIMCNRRRGLFAYLNGNLVCRGWPESHKEKGVEVESEKPCQEKKKLAFNHSLSIQFRGLKRWGKKISITRHLRTDNEHGILGLIPSQVDCQALSVPDKLVTNKSSLLFNRSKSVISVPGMTTAGRVKPAGIARGLWTRSWGFYAFIIGRKSYYKRGERMREWKRCSLFYRWRNGGRQKMERWWWSCRENRSNNCSQFLSSMIPQQLFMKVNFEGNVYIW